MINPFKQLLIWHLNLIHLSIFGSVLGGLFGGDAPDYPSLNKILPSRTATNGLLASTSTVSGDGGKSLTSTVSPTGLGQGLIDEYGALRTSTGQQYNDFSIPEYTDERYGLLKDMMDRSDLVGANRLLESQAAVTGGIGATAGSRQFMSDMAQNQEYTRSKLLLDLMGMGEQREGNLFNRYTGALGNYSGLLSGFDNAAQRDQGAFFNLANLTNQQAQGQYQRDYADYQGDMAFWQAIGAPLDMALNTGVGNIMGGGSFFGGGSPTPSVSPIPAPSSNTGGWFMGQQYGGLPQRRSSFLGGV